MTRDSDPSSRKHFSIFLNLSGDATENNPCIYANSEVACDDGNKTELDRSQGMALAGPLSCSPPDSSEEAAVEK